MESARLWLEYGDSLLSNEELNPSEDLLGAAAKQAKKAASELAKELSGDKSEGDDDASDEDSGDDADDGAVSAPPDIVVEDSDPAADAGKEEADGAETDSDMQIAWEALEVSSF